MALQDVESVADRSFSTCSLALLLADLEVNRGSRVDVERVLRMAVLHDIAESLTFDISKEYLTYMGRRGEAIKREIEDSAWSHLVDGIGDPGLRSRYARLQAEFVAGKTTEAKIVHAADGLDILLQVIEYRRTGYHKVLLADLWNSTNTKLRSSDIPSVRKLHRQTVQRAKRLSSGKVK